MPRYKLVACCLLASAAGAMTRVRQDPGPLEPGRVRVQLTSLGSPSRVRLLPSEGSETIADGTKLDGYGPGRPIELSADGDRVRLGDRSVERAVVSGTLQEVLIERLRRLYPGSVAVTARAGRLQFQNECSLEEYVTGVLARECPASFHTEAQKALAIAARSYSYRKAYLSKQPLCDTVHCQAYEGLTRIPAVIADSVRETSGLCAWYDGQPIDAVYSADCGGYREANEDAWPGTRPIAYLRGGPDAPSPGATPFCDRGPKGLWNIRVPRSRLLTLVGKALAVPTVEILDITPGGAARRVRITSAGLAPMDLAPGVAPPAEVGMPSLFKLFRGDEWRRAIGASQLKSLKFQVKLVPDGVEIQGRGNGHGVGLCQFGAEGMARAGVSCEGILKHYFNGIELAPAFSPGAAPVPAASPGADPSPPP